MSCWTVNVKGKPKRAHLQTNAVAVGDKIYFFDVYYTSREHLPSIGPLDVKVFETDTYKWSVLRNENVSLINGVQLRQLYRHVRLCHPVVYKDLVYLYADINNQLWNVFLCYNTSSNAWSKPIVTGIMPPATVDFFGLFSCVVNDAMYTFGRYDDPDSSVFAREVYKLDLKSMKWSYITTTGQPPMYRAGHSTTAIKNSIFIYGGHGDEGNCYDDVISLDTQTMNWVTHEVSGYRPIGRYAHSAVCYKGSLLVFGGVNGDHKEAFNVFERYEPDSRCWSQIETKGNGPCSGPYHSCVLIQDRVFVSGGFPTPLLDSRYPDHLDNIHACDFAPSLKTLSTVAVLEHKLNQKGLPETIRRDIKLTNPEEFQTGNNDE